MFFKLFINVGAYILVIGWFATDYNSKCTKFNSRWWCPNTSGIDAFKQFWGNDNNWLVPPPRLVCKTINKLKKEKGTLIIPQWKSAPFFGHYCAKGKNGIVLLRM